MENSVNDYVNQQIVEVETRLYTLKEEIAIRTQEVYKFESVLQSLQKYKRSPDFRLTSSVPSSPAITAKSSLRPNDKHDVNQLIANILVRANAPLHYKTILERLRTEEGYVMPGKDPAANLTARLSLAKKRFVGLGQGMYTLQDQKRNEFITVSQKRWEPRKPTMAENAQQILEEVQHPMRIRDIARLLDKKGLMGGQWDRPVLRTALRKNKIFTRISAGVYALQAWPDEQKQFPSNMDLGDQPILAMEQDASSQQSEQEPFPNLDNF